MQRKLYHYIALIVTVLFLSCGRNGKVDNVFRYNEMGDVTSLDPAQARNFENLWVDNQLYNGLIQTGDSFSVKPCIASKWEISTDRLTYTFYLRKDVFFQDNEAFPGGKGRRVVAHDFVFSFMRLLNPNVSDATSLLEEVDTVSEHGFNAPNDSMFVIHLKAPYAPFLHVLLMKYFSVVPEEAVNQYGIDFGQNPVGTGPFSLIKWDNGNAIVLKRNPNYFEKDSAGNSLPYLDGVIISFLKDQETSFLEFMDGKFDLVSGINAINPRVAFSADGHLRKEFVDKAYIQRSPFIKTDYLGFIIDDKSYSSQFTIHTFQLIRQAISYAINRKEIVRYLRYNIGIPAENGFIPPFLPGHGKVMGYSYNPDKATELLKEAGFPNGQGLPEISLFVSSEDYALAEAIQAQLQNVGIKLKVETEQPAILAQGVANGQFNFFKKSWIGDYPDAENFLSVFYSQSFSPSGINYTHYANHSFDSLYNRAIIQTNDSIRADEYTCMDKMIIETTPVIPLYYDEVIRLVNKKITGLPLDPLNSLDLRYVRKSKETK